MTSERIFRIGLVGAGNISRSHAGACKNLDRVELCAVSDVSVEALKAFGEQFDVSRQYTELDEMLEKEDLDIAVICTWGALHRDVSNRIARTQKVKAILCEKPFAQDAAEAEDMVMVARENGILLAEAFKFRHHPIHLKAKELVDEGALGEVNTIRNTFCMSGGDLANRTPDRNWRYNRSQGGGSIYDLGCYCIHHARWIFDAEPVSVYTTVRMGHEVDDAIYTLLKFPGDRTAQISCGWGCGYAHYSEIGGSHGSLRLEPVWNNEGQALTLNYKGPDGPKDFEFEPIYQFVNQLDHFCDCLETGQPNRIPPENSINQMRVIDACFESMLTGEVVVMRES